MIKYLIFISAKKGVSPEQFRTYYETKHAPLSQRLFPMCTDYRRNYYDQGSDLKRGPKLDFDVVTEMWFETKKAYEEFLEKVADPAVQAEVARDEENFLDRDTVRVLVVEEVRSPPNGYRV